MKAYAGACARRRREACLRGSEVRERDGSPSSLRAARPAASGGPPRFALGWFWWYSWPASPGCCWVLCSCVALGASRLRFKAAASSRSFGSSAVRERTALRCSLAESGTSLRLVPCLPCIFRASWRSALLLGSFGSKHAVSRSLAWQTHPHGTPRGSAPPAA